MLISTMLVEMSPWCNQCAQVKQDTRAHPIHYNEASDEPEAAHLPLAPPRMHRVEVRTGFRSSHPTPAKVSSVSSSPGKRAVGSKAQPKAKIDRAWDPTPIHPDKTPIYWGKIGVDSYVFWCQKSFPITIRPLKCI